MIKSECGIIMALDISISTDCHIFRWSSTLSYKSADLSSDNSHVKHRRAPSLPPHDVLDWLSKSMKMRNGDAS